MKKNFEEGDVSSTLTTCNICGEKTQKILELFGRSMRVKVLCSCKKKELKEQEIREKEEEKRDRLKILLKNSLMERSFYDNTFENWDFKKGDKRFYNLGLKYAENFKKIKEEGLGLLITGSVGNGKSYLSFAIANSLLKKGVPVVCISINGLLERIRETYNSWGREGEYEILKSIEAADLLVIDDLGTEQGTEWSLSKIYTILDSRYRKKLPTIVTSNYSLGQLKERYGERIVDRLIEMCINIENKNPSIRKIKAEENKEKLREMLGG